MSLQPYFDEFHEQIKLSDENSNLRTSRDAIKKTLSNGLKELADEGITLPSFFDQGSYAMGTGTKPLSGKTTFDIDEGVIFDISKDDYPDPITVKTWLAEALEDQTSLGTEIKEPCVRVVYSEGGDEKYHVDLAVYARVISESDAPLYLARGKKHSLEENKYWDISDPVTLKNLINNKFSDKNAAQFKRIIRYLKRWKDVQFHYAGKGKPTGISLTVAAYYYFSPHFDENGNPLDIDALVNLLNRVLAEAKDVSGNLQIILPVEPRNNLLYKMTELQNEKLRTKLSSLKEDLEQALLKRNINDALSLLAKHFGDDFPIDIAGTEKMAIVTIVKPNLGVFYGYTDYGQNIVIEDIHLQGYLKLRNQVSEIPLVSDKKVLSPGHYLHFKASYSGDCDSVRWQVVNTGQHALSEYNSGKNSNAFRGQLDEAKVPNSNPSKYSRNNSQYKKSDNPWETWEHTQYSGKHWIQCLAFKNGVCVAKSKKFFVNIYNPESPSYA